MTNTLFSTSRAWHAGSHCWERLYYLHHNSTHIYAQELPSAGLLARALKLLFCQITLGGGQAEETGPASEMAQMPAKNVRDQLNTSRRIVQTWQKWQLSFLWWTLTLLRFCLLCIILRFTVCQQCSKSSVWFRNANYLNDDNSSSAHCGYSRGSSEIKEDTVCSQVFVIKVFCAMLYFRSLWQNTKCRHQHIPSPSPFCLHIYLKKMHHFWIHQLLFPLAITAIALKSHPPLSSSTHWASQFSNLILSYFKSGRD